MSTTARNLALRLDPTRTARLANFEDNTGVLGTTLSLKLLDAALDYYEQHGSITFPLVVIPKSAVSSQLNAAMKEQSERNKKLIERSAEPPALHALPSPHEEGTGAEPHASTRKRKAGH